MASRIVFFVVVVAFVHSPVSAQLFGGFSPLPMGGYSEMVGNKDGPFWASLSQDNRFGLYQSPINYGVGGKFVNSAGHGLTGSASLVSGIGGQGSLRADFPIFNNPIHNVDGFAKVASDLNKNLSPVGPLTDTFGVNYKNANGASASFSQTQTHGNPASKTIEASIPVVNIDSHTLKLTGQNVIGQKETFGVNYKNANGATASFSQTQTHGNPATKTIGASIPVVNTDSHMLKLTGQNVIGQKQTLGVNYEFKDTGATASLSGTQNKNGPTRGTAAVSIPITNVGPATVKVEGTSTFGHGMKPDNKVGVQVSIPLKK